MRLCYTTGERNKKILIIISRVLALIILTMAVGSIIVASPLIALELRLLFLPNPPKPEIKYAEFSDPIENSYN